MIDDHRLNRVNLISTRYPDGADWHLFKKIQEPHKKSFEEMRMKWEKEYNYGHSREIRRRAGENLGYGEIRRAVHEYFIPLNWFHGKLF